MRQLCGSFEHCVDVECAPMTVAAMDGVLVVWSLIFVRVSAALVTWQSDSIAISVATSSDTFTLDLQASRCLNLNSCDAPLV